MQTDVARQHDIERMRASGKTLQEIATHYGISLERVRQLVPGTAPAAREARHRGRAAALRADTPEIMRRWRDGQRQRVIATELNHTADDVAAVIRANRTDLDRHRRATRATTGRDGWIAWLREYHRVHGRTPSMRAFREWDVEGRPHPAGALNHFDTWREACVAAGLTPNEARRVYERRWTNDDLVSAVAACARSIGRLPTAREYDDWAAETNNKPSGSLIRTRVGRWGGKVLPLAADELDKGKAGKAR